MNHLQTIKNKISNYGDLNVKLSHWRGENKCIVFTNGCFDLVHRGHVEYLSQAADLGDVLIIGLNSDSSVKKLKGNKRPIIDEESRGLLLAAFSFVDAVVYFEENTPYNLIKQIQPDILVKGGDYIDKQIVGYDVVMAKGGKICTIPLTPNYSTSLIEAKILSQNKSRR